MPATPAIPRNHRLTVPPAHGPTPYSRPRSRARTPEASRRAPPARTLSRSWSPIGRAAAVCTCQSRRSQPEAWLAAPEVSAPPHAFKSSAYAPGAAFLAATTPDLEAQQAQLVAAPSRYDTFASSVAFAAGTPWCFYAAVLGVVVWGSLGKTAHGSDTWQLVLNTSSSIITMLMCFILQNTLNRDTRVLHLQIAQLMQAVQALRPDAINGVDTGATRGQARLPFDV